MKQFLSKEYHYTHAFLDPLVTCVQFALVWFAFVHNILAVAGAMSRSVNGVLNPYSAGNELIYLCKQCIPKSGFTMFVTYEFTYIIHIDWPYSEIGAIHFENSACKGLNPLPRSK